MKQSRIHHIIISVIVIVMALTGLSACQNKDDNSEVTESEVEYEEVNLVNEDDGTGDNISDIEEVQSKEEISNMDFIANMGNKDANKTNINLNQIGFMPEAKKTFVSRCVNTTGQFELIDKDNNVVYKGMLSDTKEAVDAGETVRWGDFSDFNKTGWYIVRISDSEESYPFKIADDVYDDLLKDVLLMFTRQRCGMELGSNIGGDIAHPACHTSEAVIYGSDKHKDVRGGWHDAGDYGRYVDAGATAAADLLSAYEQHPDFWAKDDLGIPESGNGVPDILDEVRYELEWMLKMQDSESGGVYHKVTCRDFPGFVMPQDETDELVISPISIAATADFAAIMAKASAIYRDYDTGFADRMLEASKRAFDYAEHNKGTAGFRNPQDIVTGEYGDDFSDDEIYWAAAELYKATSEDRFHDYVKNVVNNGGLHGFGWDNMGSYANETYLTMADEKKDKSVSGKIKEQVYYFAKSIYEHYETDGYRCAIKDGYIWGSNMTACNYARQMLIASKYYNNDDRYRRAAFNQISYILGQNPTNYCFVTGYGSNPSSHPHHRPYVATGMVIPGMVVGGPNGGMQDEYMSQHMAGTSPAKAYADVAESYSTNEVAIYWNSPFLYLLTEYVDG